MMRITLLPILIAATVELIACSAPMAVPTPTAVPSATHEPTQTAPPTPTFTRTVLPTVTPPLPTRTAMRTRPPAPTRVPATATPVPTPLAPLVWDARLDALGIKLEPAKVQAGQPYWRLLRAEFWDEKENQGKHHIFVNVLDEKGARIIGQEIVVKWPDEQITIVTEEKPAPEYSANYPLEVNHYPPWHTLGAFTVWVNGLPSDRVTGMGLPPKNRFVVYWLTFQRTVGRR